MAKIVAYILGTEKYPHRLEMLSRNGIKNTKHDLEVIVLGEGSRPAVLKKDFTWLDWSNMRVADKHIEILNKKKHPDADYYVFADDDSFTDIDHMVTRLDSENEIGRPCHWSGQPGFYGQLEHINYIKTRFKIKDETIDYLKRSWIGFECTIMNRSFMNRAAGSRESKIIRKTCTEILNNGDLSAGMVGGLIGSKGAINSGITQFKNILNYSGLKKDGAMFHVHYATDNNLINQEDLKKSLETGPFEKKDLITNLFRNKFSRNRMRPKNYVNKLFNIKYFWIYWTWGGWHNYCDCPDGFCKEKIMLKRDGSVVSENGHKTLWHWEQSRRGFNFYHNGNLWSEFNWSYNGDPVGSSADMLWILKQVA